MVVEPIPQVTKVCTGCGNEKHITSFRYSQKDRSRRSQCKDCSNAADRERRRSNPDATRDARSRAYSNWREKNPKLPPLPPLYSANGRLCRTCGASKKAEDFARDRRSKDGLSRVCRQCHNERSAAWRAENIDKVRDTARGKQRDRYGKNPEKYRESLRRSRLRVKYGIEYDDLLQMLNAQNWECRICSKKLAVRTFDRRKGNVACVDHSHKSGKIRGILCSHCNRGIGLMGDNPEVLQRAAAYLCEGVSK